MKSLDRMILTKICQSNPTLQTSLVMPTVKAGREVRQNAIRFKNLLHEAIEQTERMGDPAEELRMTLSQCEPIIDDDDWWQHQDEGLALLVTSRGHDFIQLPNPPEEFVFTGTVPYIRPLVKAIQDDSRFHILAVSQNRVRLFRASKSTIEQLEPQDLPKDLRSALAIDEYQSSLQQHSSDPSIGKEGTIFHGHGGSGMEVRKSDELRLYFQKLNHALENEQELKTTPLIFAGVEYLFPMFRDTSNHPDLVAEPLTGNPDDENPKSLRDRAWGLLEKRFATSIQRLLEKVDTSGVSETTCIEIEEIIKAAQQGAVETLLIRDDAQIWGTVDGTDGSVTSRLERINDEDIARGAQDLLNLAAVKTVATGGTVYTLPSNEIGETQQAIAVLRFAIK